MNEIDDHLERLMTRKLDGELTAEESLELDQLLLRDPSARQYYEDLAQIDALAAEAIQKVGDTQPAGTGVVHRAAAKRRQWMWVGIGPAAAAACLALWISLPGLNPQPTDSLTKPESPLPEKLGGTLPVMDGSFLRKESDTQLAKWNDRLQYRSPYHSTDTRVDFYGVFDEKTEKLYILEVQRTDTQQHYRHRRQPPQQGKVMFASGNM